MSIKRMTTALLAGSVFVNRRAIAGDICPTIDDTHQIRNVCSRIYPVLLTVFIVVSPKSE